MGNDGGRGGLRPLAEAIGLAVVVVISAVTAPPGRAPLDLISSALLVLPALAVIARRRAPIPVLCLAAASLLAYQARAYPGFAPVLTVLVALYATVKAGHRRAAGVAIGVILIGGFALEFTFAEVDERAHGVFQRWVLLIGWMVAASVAAELSRQHRMNLDHLRQRVLDAERTREETARRRADEERLRIARELHDSLTHSISLINVQAGVAVHLARKHEEPVPEALVTIQEASREAMRELRATLEVLRTDDAPEIGDLDRLDHLVDGARKAGLSITVTVTGPPRSLPAPVDRAAYRIVQEALTNVARHAGPAAASVQLQYQDNELAVRVDDDGNGVGRADAVPGIGLIGMRERVTALGGTLRAGPRPDGGFRVEATLPLDSPS
jgi:signal transduction histidine kinase